jgi:solute:Na+ symporter, SSS family
MNLDLVIVVVYLAITLFIGFLFQKLGQKSISSFFRGGGGMMWWMVGTTIFMTQFSAVTFTGSAWRAYSDGLIVVATFFGNAAGFLASYLFFAAKYRQTNVDTGGEIVRARYGKTGEQFFMWANIPSSLVSTGLWLNGLAIFIAAILGWTIPTVIWVVGIIVTIISVLSGSWGIVASDFIQGVLVIMVSIFMAVAALVKVGGVGAMIEKFPGDFVLGANMNYGIIVFASFIFYVIRQTQTNNTMFSSYRFLTARDTKSARKGALLALGMMVLGTIIWFIPAWASASLYPDAPEVFADVLGNRSREAIYVVFAQRAMPVGTTGLLAAALFAATMSSMDSAINRDSGIMIKSFYLPVLRKGKASHAEMMRASVVMSVIMGLLTIGVSLFYDRLRGYSLFDLSMQVATLIQTPIVVPLVFGMVIRKTPDWSGWATALVGLFFSYMLIPNTGLMSIQKVVAALGWTLTNREVADLNVLWNVTIHLFLTGGFFFATSFFYKEPVGERKAELDVFYKNMDTPIVKEDDDEDQKSLDAQQLAKMGLLIIISGGLLSLLVFVTDTNVGRLMFGLSGLAMIGLGLFMRRGIKGKA